MTFEVIPAIDIRGGHAVRLAQGDFDRETRYDADPVAVARRWESLGAPRIHVVDLDGSRQGRPIEGDLMARICAAVAVPVEVSGGIRTLDAIEAAIAAGAGRVQLGSVAVSEPELVVEACRRFGEAITVSIDARDGRVATRGWEDDSGIDAIDFARTMEQAGVPRLMVTDIARDGMLQGPNIEGLARVIEAVSVPVIASGGVTTIEHLRACRDIGCEGAIVGRALYEGVLDLKDAIASMESC
jgi:phosphoribosylformimino-5-aminoimidazole carboxamide ribotide isomerase